MDTIYFAGFCLIVAVAILWGYRNDDFAKFNGGSANKKFSVKKSADETKPELD